MISSACQRRCDCGKQKEVDRRGSRKRNSSSQGVAFGGAWQDGSRIRDRRRQYMYCLRQYEKKGEELAAAGVTVESLLAEEKEMRRAQQNAIAT